jgi:hypothetical protein
MIRTTAPCPGGRTVTYTSSDGAFEAETLRTDLGWAVIWHDAAAPGVTHSTGTFRSEREAMDQARSRVKYYELEQRSPSR